jgi:hypothetical protein
MLLLLAVISVFLPSDGLGRSKGQIPRKYRLSIEDNFRTLGQWPARLSGAPRIGRQAA